MSGKVASSRLRGVTLTETGISKPASPPRRHGAQRLVEHRLGERGELAGPLDRVEEAVRRQVAVLRVGPPGQRLGARPQSPVPRSTIGWKLTMNSLSAIARAISPPRESDVDVGRVAGTARTVTTRCPLPLGLVHGDVGAPEQFLDRPLAAGVAGRDRDAPARLDRDPHAVDHHRRVQRTRAARARGTGPAPARAGRPAGSRTRRRRGGRPGRRAARWP